MAKFTELGADSASRRDGASCGPEHELVAIGIGEDRRGAPIGLFRFLNERHALRGELAPGFHDVIGEE